LLGRGVWERDLGLAAEWLEPAEARELEPGLSPDIAGGLWLPDESQVHAPRLTQALALQAVRLGATVLEGMPVGSLENADGRVTGVRTTSGGISAGAVVLAAGAWSSFVQGGHAAVEPVKGQMVAGTLSPACSPRHIVWGPGAYLVPKPDGQLLVGATEEPGCFDTRPTLGAIAGLVQSGSRVLPSLANMPLNTAWAGLRPASPDRRPLLGPVPGVEGLFLATGHFRNGILLAPLTAKLMAELILDGIGDATLAPYSPERFNSAMARGFAIRR
jgi:glycine oxidase